MKALSNREKLGFVVSPVVAPLVMLVETLLSAKSLDGVSEPMLSNIEEMLGIAAMYIALGAPIAYLLTLIVGLPIYIWFNNKNLVNFWSVTFGGTLVAVIPLLIMFAPESFNLYAGRSKSTIWFYLVFAACGYIVSLVFWAIAKAGATNGT